MSETTETTTDLTVEHEIRIAAPRERVFALCSDPAEMARWMPMTRFEARVGGEIGFETPPWVAVGEVIEIDPPRRVAFTWDWTNLPIGARTVVSLDLEEDGEGTIVRLRHAGFPTRERAGEHSHGWAHYEARLREVAEGRDPGPDTMLAVAAARG